MNKIEQLINYIKQNPRKILENITSYITIIIGFLGIIITYGAGFGLNGENIAIIVTISALLNRVLTIIRVNFLKDQITEPEEDNFIME
ncbi:hypothetical protein SDC9_07400 [bioreactor metagenome]|uniref:Uncharacterized protein n=1 Tax=bioreactor metagenome TaxID=1076179 RepID=A0A644T7C2_9ZZZZ|nr:hypothetical protein [Methanobrevibacter sp.]MEA4956855.1 hypothetical protein [Methanobrevibacter sp.]